MRIKVIVPGLLSIACLGVVAHAGAFVGTTSLPAFPSSERAEVGLRPFVALGVEAVVRVYQDPTIQAGRILDRGQLVQERVQEWRIGSGTVVTQTGLMLTNHHVIAALAEGDAHYDQASNRLVTASRIGDDILVYELSNGDAFEMPEKRFVARVVGAEPPPTDLAALQIVGDLRTGGRLSRFEHVRLGNPHALQPGARLTIYGYPGNVGDLISQSEGGFLNYARNTGAPDGALVSDAFIAGGNSGGAAIYGDRLVAVPTSVLQGNPGRTAGILHPVTWATPALAEARMRHGLEIPPMETEWVRHPRNTHSSRNFVYIGGRVRDARTDQALQDADVLVYRTDRSLDDVVELTRELGAIQLVLTVKGLRQAGLSIEQIAQRYYQLGADRIRMILETPVERFVENLSPDARRAIEGEFFASIASSRRGDGFFMVGAPSGRTVNLYIGRTGYRSVRGALTVGNGLMQDLGTRRLFSY